MGELSRIDDAALYRTINEVFNLIDRIEVAVENRDLLSVGFAIGRLRATAYPLMHELHLRSRGENG